MSKYYKILSITKDGRKTSFIVGEQEQVGIEYKEDEFVGASPKMAEWGHHPSVFESLEALAKFLGSLSNVSPEDSLRHYASNHNRAEIWECECEEEVPLPYFLDWVYADDWGKYSHYESLFRMYNSPWIQWPAGTKMFKRVKLTKKLF